MGAFAALTFELIQFIFLEKEIKYSTVDLCAGIRYHTERPKLIILFNRANRNEFLI